MQRLRTVTSLDVSAVTGHHAMPAALLFVGGRTIHFFVVLMSLLIRYKKNNRRADCRKPEKVCPSVSFFLCRISSEYDLTVFVDLNQLLQVCTARTAWSESDQAVRTVHSW